MLLFGHIGITIFLGALLSLPILFVAIGVLLPDVIDKVFFTLGFLPCGRSFAHNLFFGPVLALLTYAVTRRKDISLALFFGSYLHLIEDVKNFIPWFYPLLLYNFACAPIEITIGTFEVITESIGIALLIVTIFFKSKVIYLQEKLVYKLKHYVAGRINSKIRNKKS